MISMPAFMAQMNAMNLRTNAQFGQQQGNERRMALAQFAGDLAIRRPDLTMAALPHFAAVDKAEAIRNVMFGIQAEAAAAIEEAARRQQAVHVKQHRRLLDIQA